MSEIKLNKRYPESRLEDVTDAYMRGFEVGLAMRTDENAKLRELVRDMWAALWTCNQYACKHGKDGCYTEDGDNGGKCALRDRMRELGVEVIA